MRIESILLENIRSHVKTFIKFSEGFNCLVGGLGAGKSSILYALDFCLFGDPLGRSYDYLLRDEADVGRVALKFVKDGKEYTIWRALKRRNGHISQDVEQLKFFEGDRLLAEMKSDAVAEQLRAVTGIDKEIFREIIWVRQEHLKDILDLPPSERQRRLDQLFKLSDYETSWINLRPVLRWYESESIQLEHDPDITGIEEVQTRYHEAVKDLASKELELEELKRQLSEAEMRLKEASARLEELEDVRRKNEELRAEEANLQARIMSLENLSARLANEIENRRKKISELEERLKILKSQEDVQRKRLRDMGLTSDLTVEQLHDYMESLIDQVSSIQGERENIRNEIKRSAQRTADLMKENRCPWCLQTLSADYKDALMKRLYRETTENKQRLNELDENIKQLEQLRSSLNSTISSLQTILTRIEEITRQMEGDQRLLDDALQELSEKQEEERQLRSQISVLRSKIVEFDVTKLEEAQRIYNYAFEQYSSLKYKAESVEVQRKEALLRLQSLKERLDTTQRKMERREKVKKIMELVEEIRQAYRSIQPKLRGEFVIYLEKVIQQVLDELAGTEGPTLTVKVDENYTPITEGEGGYERSVLNLSGGERTLLAFAYRLGIGQLIMHWRAGHGLSMLLLDEPTESLGTEDGSINRLAESISRLKTIEQVIAVTHSEDFAEKADHIIRLEKRNNQSIASVER